MWAQQQLRAGSRCPPGPCAEHALSPYIATPWPCIRHTRVARRPDHCGSRPHAHVLCCVPHVFNFADVEKAGPRPNKTLLKREAQQAADVVRALCALTSKQRAALQPLLPPAVQAALAIAVRIPHRNQGRRRQEALVAKLLRTHLDSAALDKLQAAAAVVARQGAGAEVDADVVRTLDTWIAQLRANTQEAQARLHSYPRDWLPDTQALRAAIRAYTQVEEHAQTLARAPASVGDGAELVDEARLAAATAARARSALFKLLRPLAQKVVRAQAEAAQAQSKEDSDAQP